MFPEKLCCNLSLPVLVTEDIWESQWSDFSTHMLFFLLISFLFNSEQLKIFWQRSYFLWICISLNASLVEGTPKVRFTKVKGEKKGKWTQCLSLEIAQQILVGYMCEACDRHSDRDEKQILNSQVLERCLQPFCTYAQKLLLRTVDRMLGIFIIRGRGSLLCLVSFSSCNCFISSALYHFHIYLLYSVSRYCFAVVSCISCAGKPENQSFIDLKGRRMSWKSRLLWDKWTLNFHLYLNQIL